ncbi:hypothetical protein ACE3MQ_25065 [Paenibacillus lentus]|uniref:hypothetical protein n=1 Tax=Paenibacillus lentus TaxID=1338368 RepID=UPI003649CF65
MMDNRRLIDAEKLKLWILQNDAAEAFMESEESSDAYSNLCFAIDNGEFDPDPIPPAIKPGDTTTIKFNCRECDFECVVQYDSEVFVDIDKGHCPHCGNADAVDLEVISHD